MIFFGRINNLFELFSHKGLEQTFGGDPLYPSVEIRAANLLYFVIKDHPFTDGNKRIGSFLFLHYLERNNLLYHDNGDLRIDDNTLVAMALLIAESAPAQRELIIRLILGLFDPYKIMA